MSRWLGFFVGLAIAITVVLTVVRPESVGQQAALQDPLAIPDLPLLIADDEAEPSESPPEAPVDKTPPPPKLEPAPEPKPEEMVVAATLPDEDEDIPEPFAVPIPQFNWDAAPEPDADTEIIALPDADVVVVDNAPVTSATASTSVEPTRDETVNAVAAATAATTITSDVTLPQPASSDTRQWYAFWQPFGSEISAKGFSSRLERVTGLDYRVVKVEPGEFHVAFGYDDEESRLASLSTIEAATGLRLGGQSL